MQKLWKSADQFPTAPGPHSVIAKKNGVVAMANYYHCPIVRSCPETKFCTLEDLIDSIHFLLQENESLKKEIENITKNL